MLDHIKIPNVLFLDVETVPVVYRYKDLDASMKPLWDARFRFLSSQQNEGPEQLYRKAGVYAEFARVICISVGYFNGKSFRMRSFYGENEAQILQEFAGLLNKHFNRKEHLLCAHNGKEFDFPFLCRRMLINGIRLPKTLNIAGKKPWEVNHLDTMELWKFGDYKSYTSLSLLAAVFGIPTPKDDIEGSDVARVYWEEKDLERIVAYCQKDVLTVAQLILRFMGENLISEEDIVYT